MNYEGLKKELGHKERNIKDLTAYIGTRTNDSTPNYSLLLGAGASYSSGIKTGCELVDSWREEIYNKLSDGGGYPKYDEDVARDYLITNHSNWYSRASEYSSLFEHIFDLPAQRRRFVENQVDGKLPSIGYSYLVSLTKSRYFDTIFTTNFDDLLSEAFYQFSHIRPIVCAHDSSLKSISVSSNRPKIIKLHGDYLFDDIKSTLRETESLETNTREKFIQFSKEYGLIVIGYAGNDRSVMDVISHLLKTEDYLNNGVYWCVREQDYISPELTKLLWREKVYFVKIKGFDEALAEINYNLGNNLSFEASFTNSKKESMISFFTKDEYKLSGQSEIIKADIISLRKHKESLNIADLMRDELKGSSSGEFYEKDFKNLLTIDRLIREKEYSLAKTKITSIMSESGSDSSKKRYIKRLIQIHNIQNEETQSLKLCDKLIYLDEFNCSNYIFKANNYSGLTDRCRFISDHKERFEDRYEFLNFLVVSGIDEYKHTKASPVFNNDSLLEYIDLSLELEPSPENSAWGIKLNLLDIIYRDEKDYKLKKEKDEKINAVVEELGKKNKICKNYLQATLGLSYIDKDFSKLKKSISHIREVYLRSSVNRKSIIFDLLCETYSSLQLYCEDGKFKEEWMAFFESDIFKENNKKELSIDAVICNAKYQLEIEEDVEACIKLFSEAANYTGGFLYASDIVRYLLVVGRQTKEALIFIEKEKNNISKNLYHNLKSEALTYAKKYDLAIIEIEKSFEYGLPLDDYLCAISFIFLKAEKFQKAINIISSNLDKVKFPHDKDMLTINLELAKKLNGDSIDDVIVRNIAGRAYSNHLAIAAECLISTSSVKLKRLIKKSIERDYFDLFVFEDWPVIPAGCLEEFKKKPSSTLTGEVPVLVRNIRRAEA